MSRSVLALAAFGAMAFSALPAMAQDVYFEIVNNSSRTLVQFFSSPTYDTSWGYDILGTQVLPPGYSTTVVIADGETACVYDMRFVFDNGAAVEGQSDICRQPRYVLQ